ncbi:YbjQ family protein [Planktomarina temperata]|nr:YbjQ family protein [Planktomarina temperata]
MAECKECGTSIKAWEAIGGACEDCYSLYLKKKALLKEREANAEREQAVEELGSVLLTTAHTLQDVTVTKYLGVVSAECAYGMNMFKDMFANVRNLVGGRSAAVEDTMRDSRETVMQELKREAHAKGANAVIAVDLDYTQLGAGGNMMVLVSASGTAVIVEE